MIHYSFFGYVLAVGIILLICCFAYRFVCENKLRPPQNRIIMISLYAIALLVPFLVFPVSKPLSSTIEPGQLQFIGFAGEPSQAEGFLFPSIEIVFKACTIIYFIGFGLLAVHALFGLFQLVVLKRKSKVAIINGEKVFVHHNRRLSSFSWNNRIFIYHDAFEQNPEDLKVLISHEKAHIQKMHWIDLIFAQLFVIFQWFNPAAWYMRRELQRIHEYEADASVLSSGTDEKNYQMLLIRNISGSRYSGLTDRLNNCSLKKRILMMKTTNFKENWLARSIAIAAFALLGIFILNLPGVASTLETKAESAQSIDDDKIENRTIKHPGNIDSESITEMKYYIDGRESDREELESLSPEDIREMSVDKSGPIPLVTITTKASGTASGQPKSTVSVESKNSSSALTVIPEKMAQYKGGEQQLLRDLSEAIYYPEEAMENKVEGQVIVRFQINPNGSISDCEVLRPVEPSLDQAAVQAVKKLSGNWDPAEVDGHAVASSFVIPVSFKLKSTE